MLSPDDRKLYSSCFAAPAGYVFDCAVGTTYSLDLESLLFAQFCLATSGSGEPEVALQDPVGLLEAIHRTEGRVTVFYHAGETKTPERPQALYGLLEPSLAPARARSGDAVFHPKLWVLRFRDREAETSFLRVVVLSRNLTTSRTWDAFVCLEGAPEGQRDPHSQELADLLRALPQLSLERLSLARRSQLQLLAREVERTSFAAPPPFEETARFRVMGIGPGRRFRPEESAERILAISPFVSPTTLQELRQLAPGGANAAELIGRPEELAKCPAEVIAQWNAFTLDDAACSPVEADDGVWTDSVADPAPSGLHANAFVFQAQHSTSWWLGSGNLTDSVRNGSNVELMVRLEGQTSKVGIDAFLGSGVGSLLLKYKHRPLPGDPREGNRYAVAKAKKALAAADLTLRCESRGGSWDLVLTGTTALPEGVMVSCRPITLPPSRSLEFTENASEYRFSRVTMEALTALVSFQLSAGSGEFFYETSITLKLSIAELPEERDARISRSIIKDRAAFLNYLCCSLAGVAGALPEGSPANAKERQKALGDGSPLFASGLLEQLFRALHREPERLGGIRSLLEQAGAVGESGESPIPEEFREIWRVVEPHLPESEAASDGSCVRIKIQDGSKPRAVNRAS